MCEVQMQLGAVSALSHIAYVNLKLRRTMRLCAAYSNEGTFVIKLVYLAWTIRWYLLAIDVSDFTQRYSHAPGKQISPLALVPAGYVELMRLSIDRRAC